MIRLIFRCAATTCLLLMLAKWSLPWIRRGVAAHDNPRLQRIEHHLFKAGQEVWEWTRDPAVGESEEAADNSDNAHDG